MEQEKQIWQRVFAQPAPEKEDLRPLAAAAAESAAAFRHLAGTLTGPAREKAKALYQAQQETLACLRGLQALSGGGMGTVRAAAPGESAPAMLKKAYHRSKWAMTEYTARSLDGEAGMVFQELAQGEARRCTEIARLLGMLL